MRGVFAVVKSADIRRSIMNRMILATMMTFAATAAAFTAAAVEGQGPGSRTAGTVRQPVDKNTSTHDLWFNPKRVEYLS